jgi:hypothetical protein
MCFQAHNTNVMYRLTHIEPGIDQDIPRGPSTSKGMTNTAPPTYLSLPVPTLSTH